MHNKEIFIYFFNFSKSRLAYLADKHNIKDYELRYLYPQQKLENLEQAMEQLAFSLQNRQRLPNIIRFAENKGYYQKILCGFNPKLILTTYKNPEEMYKKIKGLETSKSSRIQYAEYIFSAALFLSQFKDIFDFKEFINRFSYNYYTNAALPMILSKEIKGLGFALACDFLKEIGLDKYPKPDTHIIMILEELGLLDSNSKDKTYLGYKIILELAEVLKCTPYYLDKVLWLNCTGNFYLDNKKIETSRVKFLQEYKNK